MAEYPMIYSLKLGVVYRPDEQQSYYWSAGHGFSHPTMEESLASDGMLSFLLKPEQGVTTELGARLWLYNNRLSLNASVYTILLNDLLITRRPVEDVFYGENAGSALLQGVELQAGFRFLPALSVNITAEASDNRFLEYSNEDGDFQGLQLPGIPQYRLQAEADATLMPGLRLVLNQTLVGKQYYNDANTLSGNAWMRTDLRLSYSFTWKKLQFETAASLRNIFDERYASMILVNAPAFGTRPPRYYYPALPRNAVFSMKIRYR
jgi:iron complex outermembrane receptor protein